MSEEFGSEKLLPIIANATAIQAHSILFLENTYYLITCVSIAKYLSIQTNNNDTGRRITISGYRNTLDLTFYYYIYRTLHT